MKTIQVRESEIGRIKDIISALKSNAPDNLDTENFLSPLLNLVQRYELKNK